MKRTKAEIIREYGPFPGVENVAGVSHDGTSVWFASGERLNELDPASGEITRTLQIAAQAGTAFDGRHLFQIAEGVIRKIDPESGQVLATIPAPTAADNSGLAWAEGLLWVGQHRGRSILQLDPETGKVLRTLRSDRFVTGVTWAEGALWHATWEEGESEIRRLDSQSGAVLERLELPPGMLVSGLEADGGGCFFCGGADSGKVRAIRRPAGAS